MDCNYLIDIFVGMERRMNRQRYICRQIEQVGVDIIDKKRDIYTYVRDIDMLDIQQINVNAVNDRYRHRDIERDIDLIFRDIDMSDIQSMMNISMKDLDMIDTFMINCYRYDRYIHIYT